MQKENHIMAFLLGIDIGTSGTKTVLFDEKGHGLASYTGEYGMQQPQNGWAEQNPEDWWQAVVDGIRAVLAKSGVKAADIAGVGLSGQMHGLTMLDKDDKVLRPAIIWCDQRTAKECEEIEELMGGRANLIAITANPALTGFTAGKIRWVQKHEPEIYTKCAHMLLPKDYIRLMLTGEYATEVSDASGMQLLDVPNRCWSDTVLEKLDIDKKMLGKVYESPEVTGRVTARVAELTGLKAGTPVVGGAGDNAAAAVGTGVVREGRAFTTIGTSGVVFAHTDQVTIDPLGRAHTFCCAVPGAWHVMGVTQAAGLSLKWFRDSLCAEEVAVAKEMGVDSYDLINQEVKQSPIGANRLFYLPYLMGERTPHLDADCRGAFVGLSAIHGKKDLLRAVMEGVAYSLKDCQSLFGQMGLSISHMAACGGGAKSPIWCQMLADLYGCDIMTVKGEGGALGVALLAGVGAGIYASVPEACDATIEYGRQQSPDADAEKYLKNYEFYRTIYPALKETYAQLAKL